MRRRDLGNFDFPGISSYRRALVLTAFGLLNVTPREVDPS